MKLRKKQKCAAVVLVCCILFQTTYYCVVRPNVVYATGAGGIAGGAVAGLGLTGPEVAVAIAALFGVAAVVDNADTIYTEMNNCINKVTDGLENQAAVISDWWKEAAAGVVDTTSSVWKGVCNWFTGTRDNYYSSVGTKIDCKAGDKVSYMNYQRGSSYVTASKDCTYVEFYYKIGADVYYPMGRFWVSADKDTYLKQYFSDGSTYCRNFSYSEKYGFYFYLDTTLLTSGDDWKGVLTKYLPDAYYLGEFDRDYKMTTDTLLSLLRPYVDDTLEKLLGGINKVLDENIIDDAADVIWPDTIVLNPDLAADEELASVLEKLRSGELTWTDCWDRVASGERVGVKTDAGTFTLDDAGVTDVPYEKDATDAPPADTDVTLNDSLADYKTDGLTSLFPFCIPFDLINCIKLMSATGEAPCWEFPFKVPMTDIEDTITIDLAKWDSVAAVCRSVETLLFIGLLISRTREFIRG